METKRRIIMKHISGVPVNIRYEPVDAISKANRFKDIEEYERFITGFYKPVDASQFMPVEIEILYREVSPDE